METKLRDLSDRGITIAMIESDSISAIAAIQATEIKFQLRVYASGFRREFSASHIGLVLLKIFQYLIDIFFV